MRILIYGAGAVGGYVGGQLALAGHTVTLLVRETTAQTIAANGLTLHLADGTTRDLSAGSIHAVASPQAAFAGDSYDWLAFTMKAYDTLAAIQELLAATNDPPPVLCLQNGVGNEESLASALGADKVVAGTLTTPVSVAAPGVLVEEKARGIALSDALPAAKAMLSALRDTSLSVEMVQHAESLKWSKLLLNQMGNATSAIMDMPPGDVYANRRLFAIERAALIETLGVMQIRGIPTTNLPGVPARTLERLVRRLPSFLLKPALTPAVKRGRGNKMPSFHNDLAQGRKRSEVIWLNGAVARAADAAGLRAPVNHALALTLMDIAEGRARWEQFKQQPDMLETVVRLAR